MHELLQSLEEDFKEPLQVSEQVAEHDDVHEFEQSVEEFVDSSLQVVEQDDEQESLQEPLQSEHFEGSESFSQDERIMGPKAIAPSIGNILLAAFLKNSRLDWSSSIFFFFSSIITSFYELILIISVNRCNTHKVQRMAWPLLCTYLRGAPEKMEPLYSYKNAPRQGVCIA